MSEQATGRMRRAAVPRRRRGASLIELMASVTIMSILALALGSAMMVAARASEQATAIYEQPQTQDAAADIARDLQLATSFSERTTSAATFAVPDRDGDALPETIRYAWSGTAGDPLTYQYNSGAAVPIATGVQSFSLTYLLRATAGSGSTTPQEQESAELLLIYHHDAPGGSLQSKTIQKKKGAAQYFKPTLPTNTTTWKITRARVRAQKQGSATGILTFRITTADGSMKPTWQVLGTVQIPESSLSGSWSDLDIQFASIADLDPAAGYCLTILDGASGKSGSIRWEKNGSPMTPNTHYMTTNNAGSSWSNPADNKDMLLEVYGTVTTLGEPQWP